MDNFHPTTFFNLEHFQHASLFKTSSQVWEVFTVLPAYLKNLPLGNIEVLIPPGVVLEHPELVSIGKGTVVEPGTLIRGPCIIGKNCSIRQGAYIRGYLVTGDNCVIGHCSEVKNSIMLDNSKAPHFAYLGETVLGNNVNLGAGVKCANLKLDGKEIIIHHAGKHFATGLRKFGAIIGDDSQLGCNSVTNPGTLIGKYCHLFPCTNFGGIAPDNSQIGLEIRAGIITKTKK